MWRRSDNRFRFLFGPLVALIVCLALYSGLAQAQDAPVTTTTVSAPEVSSSVDKVEAFVGDALTFVISVVVDSATKVAPLNIEKKLGDFEIQDVQLADVETLKDGRKRYQTILKLWALETGEFQIPSVSVYYTNPGAKVDSLVTSAITVTVSSVVGEDVDSASIKPLRDPLEDPLGLKQGFLFSRLFWGLVIALVVIIGALVWWRRSRQGGAGEAWVDPRPSWEIALDRLAELRNEPLLAQGLFKQYYSELTDTLRDYLGSALEIHTLDMTTAELLRTIERGSVTAVYKPQIASALTQADMIKFAKATPAEGRPEKDFETVYSVVVSIRDDLVENRRKEEERLRELKAKKSPKAGSDDSHINSDVIDDIENGKNEIPSSGAVTDVVTNTVANTVTNAVTNSTEETAVKKEDSDV